MKGVYQFEVTAPKKPGTYVEKFSLIAEGLGKLNENCQVSAKIVVE